MTNQLIESIDTRIMGLTQLSSLGGSDPEIQALTALKTAVEALEIVWAGHSEQARKIVSVQALNSVAKTLGVGEG